MREKKATWASERLVLFILILLTGTTVTLVYLPPLVTLTEEKRTGGSITFTDSTGSPLDGTIEININGAPKGIKTNVSSISWMNAPNARISLYALDTENVSVSLRISGDSPGGIVTVEDYGDHKPPGVAVSAPGVAVQYLKISTSNISVADSDVSVQYTDADISGFDESSLALYIYDRDARKWHELPQRINMESNIISATVDRMSAFAVSVKASGRIDVSESFYIPLTGDIRIYDASNVTGNPTLNVTVNRWVILDDPNTGSAGSGFSNPSRNWNSNYWSGESTLIRMHALTVNNTGRAVSTQVTFTLKDPGGTVIYQNTVTSSSGVASDSYNVNAQNYYGYWTVTATATIDGVSLNKSTRFIYEWWGCADCHGRKSPSMSGTATSSSPYLHGYDPIVSRKTQHQTTCTTCHRGYTPAGVHTGKSCTDCHGSITTHKTD